MTLALTGILSAGWFGIPLIPKYFLYGKINIVSSLFALFSALGSIWGVMAYLQFTRSANIIMDARGLSKKLDPLIGDYEYRSYNPETKEYEKGFIPLGPIDFWDRETQVPGWLDKGKYWRILLGFQSTNKDILLQVVCDEDLPFMRGKRNVALTYKETTLRMRSGRRSRKHSVFRIKIPQWVVMNTERARFADQKARLNLDDAKLSPVIAEINQKLVTAADEIIDHEKPRIQYAWSITTAGIYLNKSLPIRIIYREVVRRLPGSKKRTITDINANLANVKDNDLIEVIVQVAIQKGISEDVIRKIQSLIRFLKNAYTRQGLGEGSSEYHNFHHSLEVSYMCIQILPKELRGFSFDSKDYELILVAGLLHDYDPNQIMNSENTNEIGIERRKGPKVFRTISEICKTRILDAYFTMDASEFDNYFREYRSALLPPVEFATTHPEYVKILEDRKPIESIVVEALIWRTDFPYHRQIYAKDKFERLVNLFEDKQKHSKIRLLGEILWIADLAVTYMGSDPIRAWDRVTNLYDELELPKVEAVSRTDAYFADFADTDLFKEVVSMRHFPYIFRQRWNMVYQFFHEGNPSTQINRIISKTRNLYLRINMEISMRKGDMLQEIATNNWAEYFIGIGKDQNDVLKAKSKLAELDPPNASAFWGDAQKLLPSIVDKSIDNFLMVIPEIRIDYAMKLDDESSLKSILRIVPEKLSAGGTLQILTDLDPNSSRFKELMALISSSQFQIIPKGFKKVYFPNDWKDSEFIQTRTPQILLFTLREA
jgi:Putative methyltransferase